MAEISEQRQAAIDNYIKTEVPLLLRGLNTRMGTIVERQDNWDSKGSKQPCMCSVGHTQNFLADLMEDVIKLDSHWYAPFISSDAKGNIELIWCLNTQGTEARRELHLTVLKYDVEYIKVWGVNNSMEVGILKNKDILTHWKWLHE